MYVSYNIFLIICNLILTKKERGSIVCDYTKIDSGDVVKEYLGFWKFQVEAERGHLISKGQNFNSKVEHSTQYIHIGL